MHTRDHIKLKFLKNSPNRKVECVESTLFITVLTFNLLIPMERSDS